MIVTGLNGERIEITSGDRGVRVFVSYRDGNGYHSAGGLMSLEDWEEVRLKVETRAGIS